MKLTSLVGAFEGEDVGEAVGLFEGCELKRQEINKNEQKISNTNFYFFSSSFDIRTW